MTDEARRGAQAIRKIVDLVVRDKHIGRIVYGTVTLPVTTPVHSVTFTEAVPPGVTAVGQLGVRYLASYTPTSGDTVLAIAYGTDKVIIGKIA
jgi:hypothetical protein